MDASKLVSSIGQVTYYDVIFLYLKKLRSRSISRIISVSLSTTIGIILGTVCDAGVFAPVLSFQKLFEAEGVPITDAETRAPMGVHKRVME